MQEGNIIHASACAKYCLVFYVGRFSSLIALLGEATQQVAAVMLASLLQECYLEGVPWTVTVVVQGISDHYSTSGQTSVLMTTGLLGRAAMR